MKKIGRVSYRVELPSWCKIHKVLHVSVLKPYFADKEDASRNEPKQPMFKLKKAGKKLLKLFLTIESLKLLEKIIRSTWSNGLDAAAMRILGK